MERLEKPLCWRINFLWQLNGEMGNWATAEISVSYRLEEANQAARSASVRMDKNVDADLVPVLYTLVVHQ